MSELINNNFVNSYLEMIEYDESGDFYSHTGYRLKLDICKPNLNKSTEITKLIGELE
jgi:hypothetical protein